MMSSISAVDVDLFVISLLSYLLSSSHWDWLIDIEDLLDTEDYGHSRKVLSRHYDDVTEAIHNSNAKEEFENELKQILNTMTVRARAHAIIPSSSKDQSSKGNPLSMIPASSKRQKTHGTKHN
jgi:hypothetical protein